jgi:signal peptidase I
LNTSQQESEKRKPNKWLAALMGFFLPPIGMLYVAQPVWAAVYLAARLMVVIVPGEMHAFGVAKVLLTLAIDVVCAIQAYRFAACYPADRVHPRYSRGFGALGVLLLALLPVALLVRTFVLEPFHMPSGSMLPTVAPGDHVSVQKWGFGHYSLFGGRLLQGRMTAELHRGDVIVFDAPDKPRVKFIKRVIGLPGDTLIYRDDKTLVVNGKAVLQQAQGDFHAASAGSTSQQFSRLGETLDGTGYSVVVKKDRPWVYHDYAFDFREGCVYSDHALSCTVPQGQYFVLGDNRDNSRDSRYFGFVPAADIVGKVVSIW